MSIELNILDETEILADLNEIAYNYGLINKVFETSRINIYYSVFARVFGNIIQVIAGYIEQNTINDSTDEVVLEQLLDFLIVKRDAKSAKTILTFTKRDMTKNMDDIYIPRNLEVMTEGNNPVIFRTAESKIFWKDSFQIKIPAYSVNYGNASNVGANTLVYFEGDLFHDISVTNEDPAYGGSDEETSFDSRNRLRAFRYSKDGTLFQIEDILGNAGFFGANYNIQEYWDGFGSVLIALDCQSESEFQDAISKIQSEKVGGIKYHYVRAQPVYLDLKITAKVLGEKTYDTYEESAFEDDLVSAINLFFNQQVYVGDFINIKRLEAFVLNYIYSTYTVYEINLEILNLDEIKNIETSENTGYDLKTNTIKVEPYEKIKPDRIITEIQYNYLEDGD